MELAPKLAVARMLFTKALKPSLVARVSVVNTSKLATTNSSSTLGAGGVPVTIMSSHPRKGFTALELLIVIAVISVLSALLLPAYVLVREKAQRTSCLSNLKQIGNAIEMYKQDYDGRFPYAVDPIDKNAPAPPFPTPFQAQIPNISMINEVLQPYCARHVFRCPSDSGFDFDDRTGILLNARPTSYEKYQTSYYYRTEFAAFQIAEAAVTEPTKINLMFDGNGRWHAGGLDLWSRYNVLFADEHVKNLTRSQFDEAWYAPISAP